MTTETTDERAALEAAVSAAGRKYAQATEALEGARGTLDGEMRAARKGGLPVRRIAELAGISFSRVQQVTGDSK